MARDYSFFIKNLDNVEGAIENLSIGTHRMRANSMSAKGEISELTTLSPEGLDKIEVFGVTITTSHVTLDKTITRIIEGSSRSVSITAEDGYSVPDSVTVTGATGTYTKTDSTHATLSISNPTAAVSCTINGVQ